MFVKAITSPCISHSASTTGVVKVMPVAHAPGVSSTEEPGLEENATAVSPKILHDRMEYISSQVVSLFAPSTIRPAIGVTKSIFWSLKPFGSAKAGEAATLIVPTRQAAIFFILWPPELLCNSSTPLQENKQPFGP